MRTAFSRLQYMVGELKRRSVFRVCGVYAAGCFLLLQVADLTFPVLPLPERAYALLVYAAVVGFPLVALLAWFFDVTTAGVHRADAAPAFTAGPGNTRPARLMSVGVLIGLLVMSGSVAALRVTRGTARAEDGRIALAIFPFRAVGTATGEWSEGVADLLATTLDGTEGVRVIDPWALWSPLRNRTDASSLAPDPAEAARLGRAADARRIVLGSTVTQGERVDLNIRIYDPRFPRPLHTFAVSGARDAMPALVQRLAVEVITRLWDGEQVPSVGRLEPNVTRSADALKAYLAAKSAMRRGQIDSAAASIDRAIALDSTFALALVDAVAIHSWRLSMTGQPFSGFRELLQRAAAHDDSLSERFQLRLQAMQASIDTRGLDAARALRRIIEIDSTDLNAWSTLSYVQNVYGWQFNLPTADMQRAVDRVVELDSSYIPGLITQSWIRISLADSAGVSQSIEQLAHTDTTVPMARLMLRGLRLFADDDRAFAGRADALATAPAFEWITPLRLLRLYDVERSEALLLRIAQRAAPPDADIATAELARLRIAQGRTTSADSMLATGTMQPARHGAVQRLLITSALAGVADTAVARRAADELGRALPPESALAQFNSRAVWWEAWVLGAYHAQLGDTAAARRWHDVIATLPAGGSPATYREATRADIAARLAVRRGDRARALLLARQALELWTIHTENQFESMPEPAMRFHLAQLLRDSGRGEEAEPLLRSLTPPAGWQGFYTARASLELGELALAAGDTAASARYFANAWNYWQHGGPEVARWRQQVEARLARPG